MSNAREFRSFCRICSAICGIIVEVEDDRVINVRGDRDHALSRGFTCVKGRNLGRMTHHRNRFLASQRRQDDGSLAPIAFDRATREIAVRLQEIISTHGPDSVGMYIGTQNYNASLVLPFALAWFLAPSGSHKLFTTATIDQSAKQVRAMRLGGWEAGRQRFEDSDVWMLIGNNPLVSLQGGGLSGFYQHDPIRSLQQAKERGLRLIVVDPRRTETATWADVHLQLRPGTDAVLLAGLLHLVFAANLVDHAFCAEYANGVDVLRAAVAGATPDFVAERTGVSVNDLLRAARCFGEAARGMATTGTGPNMAPYANLSEHLVGCLNVVCGRFPRAGDRQANAAVLKAPGRARAQVTAPRWPPPSEFTSRVRGVPHFDGELPSAIFADEILEPGDDRVRALVVSAGNPAAAVPDQEKIVRALSSLELLVTVDPFPSQTARLADYVIAPTLSLERPDFTRPYEGSFSVPFAQYTDAVLPRPGEVVEDWEFFLRLASELGWTLQIGRRVFEPGQPVPSPEDMLASFAASARVPIDQVRRFPGGHVFGELEPPLVQPPDGTGARFELAPDDVLVELEEALTVLRDDERFPLRLVSRRTKESFNTTGTNIPLADPPYNPCMLHPSDLERLGIIPGERVEVTSPYGTVVAVADADVTLRPGVVSLAHCYGDLPGCDDDPRTGAGVERVPAAVGRPRAATCEPHAEDERRARLGCARAEGSVVKLDVSWVPEPGNDDEVPAAAERAGYDAVLVAEIAHDPFLALAVASNTTSRIGLGTGIALAFARSPMTTALTADDLQRMSRGRFILGLGSQVKAHVERRFSMPWSRPADRMREYVLALRAIWRSWHEGEPLCFEGEFYRHTLMTPAFIPGANPYGPPKVLVAAVGERMARVAGEVGDGLLIHPFCSPRYLSEVTLPAVARGLAVSGRARSDFEIGGAVYVATGRDEGELAAARERVRSTIAFHASTLAYRPVLDLHGWGELQPALNDLARRDGWSDMAALVNDEVLDALAVVAPLDELADALHRRYDGILDRMTFTSAGAADPDRYAAFVDAFRSRVGPAVAP